MRGLLPIAALAASVTAGTVSMSLTKRSHNQKRFVLSPRDTIDLTAINNISSAGYYAEAEIGTPPQKLTFQLDTGSSDTWVNSDRTRLCSSNALQQQYGDCQTTFNESASNTFSIVDEGGFNISYLDGRGAAGDYFRDSIKISGVTITKQQMGLALDSRIPTGLLGLGLSIGVSTEKKYPTILDNLLSQGHINTRAFSLFLNSPTADSGSILFGGIDSKKFVGKLETLPLKADGLSSTTEVTSYSVQMSDFTVDGIQNVPSLSNPVVLDSGSTICVLPKAQVNPIHDHFGVLISSDLPSTPFVDCSKAQGSDVTFSFKFQDKNVTVPTSDMIIDSLGDGVQPLIKNALSVNWDRACLFGMVTLDDYLQDPSTTLAILGDTFLRSAYVVYDLDHQTIGIAQANTDTSDSNVVEFQRNGTIPTTSGVDAPTNNDQKNAAGTLYVPTFGVAIVASIASLAAFMTTL